MKKIIICSAILFIILNINAQNVKVGDKAPKIQFETSYPKGYKIPEGKFILLDFWATWCGPCVAGLIEANNMVDKYSDRIEFIAITDQSSTNVEKFIKQRQLKYKVIIESPEAPTHKAFGVRGIPDIYILDDYGTIIWRGSKVTEELIKGLLAGKSMEKESNYSDQASEAPVESVSQVEMPRKSVSLIINEEPVKDFEYSSSIALSTDSTEVIMNEMRMNDIIETFSEYRVDVQGPARNILKRYISVQYSSVNMTPEASKSYMIRNIAEVYSLRAENKVIDTLVWHISVSNNRKLSKSATTMTNKHAGQATGQYYSFEKNSGELTCLGTSVKELADFLEKKLGAIFEFEGGDDTAYDFIKVNAGDMKSLSEELMKKYGLKLESRRKEISFLVIEPV